MLGFFAVAAAEGLRSLHNQMDLFKADRGQDYVSGTIEKERCFLYRCVLNKFQNDQVFFSGETVTACLDGVLLNKNALLQKYKCGSLEELLSQFAVNDRLPILLKELRGAFSGILVTKDQAFVFVDQLAVKQLFYTLYNGVLIVASEVSAIAAYMKAQGWRYTLDEAGAYCLMSYAFMYMDHTLVREIKRVKEGTLLTFDFHTVRKERYYAISNQVVPISRPDAVERIDELFTAAVRLQLEKNAEYGYEDVVPLSAGMDCRMTSYAARKILEKPFLNFTYSEYGQEDCVIPGQMAHDLGNRWIFKSLDNGLDMYNIEESIKLSEGLIYYMWPAQLNDFLKLMDTRNWGIVHTGVLGDVILGNYRLENRAYYRVGCGAYSRKLIPRLLNTLPPAEVDRTVDTEVGTFENRGINGIGLGYSTSFRETGTDLSPFMNIDFFDFCLSLPLKYRTDHSIYYEWVQKKYPQAAKFKHNGVRVGHPGVHITIPYRGNQVPVEVIPGLILSKLKKRYKLNYGARQGMNPLQYWYETNQELKNRMDTYFRENLDSLSPWPSLRQDAEDFYQTGTALEKSMAVSAVGSVRMFFS